MGVQLINIGFGNMAAATRVIAIISPESAPVKRMIQDCRDKGELIDATYGRKTRAVLIMDSGQTILSAVQPETISHRLMNRKRQLWKRLMRGKGIWGKRMREFCLSFPVRREQGKALFAMKSEIFILN